MADTQDRHDGTALHDFLSVLFRRKWIVLVLVLATLAAVLYAALRAAPVFESYAKVLVSRGQFTTAFAPNIKLLTWEEELTSEMEAVRSARILKRAQELLAQWGTTNGAGQPYTIDPAQVQTSIPGKSSVIQITYRGHVPEAARQTVRALTQAYEEFRSSTRLQDPSDALEKEISNLEAELTRWEQRRAEYLGQEGAVELPEERLQLLTERRTLEADLSAAEAEVAKKEARFHWTRRMLSDDSISAANQLYPFGDPEDRGESVVTVLRKLLLTTQAEYYDAKAQYTEDHPRVLALKERIEELRQNLVREGDAYLGYLAAQLEAARASARSLQSSVDYIDQRLSRFPDRQAQLLRMDRAIATLRETHDGLVTRRVEALSNRLGTTPWDVVVLQDAVDPYVVRGMRTARLVVIVLFSLLVAIGLAFLVDRLDPSFKEAREIEADLKVPVLGEVRRFR